METQKTELRIEPITEQNRTEAESLHIASAQTGFIESVVDCLKEADKKKCWRPVGIYAGNTMVGFAMYGVFWMYFPFGRVWLDRLMIDERYQGRGYGKTALRKLLNRLQNEYKRNKIYLSVYKENRVAIQMYEKAGFRFTRGKDIHGELVMSVKLSD